jgi:hypothetical protein
MESTREDRNYIEVSSKTFNKSLNNTGFTNYKTFGHTYYYCDDEKLGYITNDENGERFYLRETKWRIFIQVLKMYFLVKEFRKYFKIFLVILFITVLMINYKYYRGDYKKIPTIQSKLEDMKTYTYIGTLQVNEKYKTIFVYRKDGENVFMNSDGEFDSSEIYKIKN